MNFVFLLVYGIAVARLGGVVPAALVALGAIALGICEFPTRKKFYKIVNDKPRKLNQESGRSKPKNAAPGSDSELSRRSEC